MNTHQYFMQEALSEAKKAADCGEIPVGAVIVKDGEIIGRGHNTVERDKNVTRHAELIALEEASKKLQNWRLSEATLYVTLEPCPMCIGALVLSRISEIYFASEDERLGAVGSLFNLANHPDLPHHISVFSGLLAEESKALLQDFFQARR